MAYSTPKFDYHFFETPCIIDVTGNLLVIADHVSVSHQSLLIYSENSFTSKKKLEVIFQLIWSLTLDARLKCLTLAPSLDRSLLFMILSSFLSFLGYQCVISGSISSNHAVPDRLQFFSF